MKLREFHQRIARDVLGTEPTELDALLFMLVLNRHWIILEPSVRLEGVKGPEPGSGIAVFPTTRGYAAEVLASLWQPCDERSQSEYWHSLYNQKTPYSELGQATPSERARIEEIMLDLLSVPEIAELKEDV